MPMLPPVTESVLLPMAKVPIVTERTPVRSIAESVVTLTGLV